MKIGVIGLGLIGGSIFKDLTKLGYDTVGISKSQQGENIYKDFKILQECSLIFVCSAMNKTLQILEELDSIVKPETIVTDVCSLKQFVCNRKYSYNFVPSHPMAGTEKQGFENSFEGLFKDAKWVITPIAEIDYTLLTEIIENLGAKPVITTPKKHDEAVALVSHMPMLIAQAIFKTAQENNLALEIASSGFRDMTRLAMSNVEMANDMITINSENIENSLLLLYKSIGELTNNNYLEQIIKIKEKRNKMF